MNICQIIIKTNQIITAPSDKKSILIVFLAEE